MNLILPLLLFTATAEAPQENRHPDAIEVYRCDFDKDVNYNQWPDGWTRLDGPKYPRYLEVGIRNVDSPSGKNCLRMDLNGGAVTIYSPPIEISPQFSYVVEAFIKTEKLIHDEAYYSITFYDGDKKALETKYSDKIQDASDWTKVKIPPITPSHNDIQFAVIGLHLKPKDDSGKADLQGAALFDDIWLARLPRMVLRSNSEHSVYTDPSQVEVTCKVSGILERDPEITFELIDVSSNLLARKKENLDGQIVAMKKSKASKIFGKTLDELIAKDGYKGQMSWKPGIKEYGFYVVKATMLGKSGVMHHREISMAVTRPQPNPTGGEFGWSIPRGDDPLPLSALASLLGKVGINWAKFPVWYGETDLQRANRLGWFSERLRALGIEMIGMLDQPPDEVRYLFDESKTLQAATIFSDPELWRPILAPVMTRMSLKIRWWQLGHDEDTSYVGYRDLAKNVAEVKNQLERFGQEIHLGIGWNWLHGVPQMKNPPWDFLSHSADPPLTQQELADYLAMENEQNVPRWVVIKPLSRKLYGVQDRARDLVGRMLAAKMENADRIFIPDPFSADHGLMNSDGTPGELLLAWRTTAQAISGATYLGRIRLPNGSDNYVFSRDGKHSVMVVWNEKPTSETIYLGEDVQQFDLWGRTLKITKEGHRQTLEVGSIPTFVTGVNENVAKMRMSFDFQTKKLSSVFGRSQKIAFKVANYFRTGIGGGATLVKMKSPKSWEIRPNPLPLKLAAGDEKEGEFYVMLSPTASSGSQEIRVDFNFKADQDYQFSVYREINVGEGDIVLEFSTWINEKGDLVVVQHMTNRTDQFVSFKCELYTPGRRSKRQNVLKLARGRSKTTYVLADGKELVGKTLRVKANEIGGERILISAFTVEQ